MEYEWWKSSRILEDVVIKCILRESNEKWFSVWSTSSFSLTLWRVSTVVVVDQCMSAIKTHWNNYMARLEPCHCCPDCNYNYCYKTETTAVEPTHLDYLIDEAHMSDRVSLLHQNLLQMLHLKNMQQRNLHTIFISLADRVELRFWCVNEQSVTIWTVSRHTCLHAAHIWSISFSRLVHRAARKAAVLPGVGSTALPGAPGGRRQLIALFLLFRWEKMR